MNRKTDSQTYLCWWIYANDPCDHRLSNWELSSGFGILWFIDIMNVVKSRIPSMIHRETGAFMIMAREWSLRVLGNDHVWSTWSSFCWNPVIHRQLGWQATVISMIIMVFIIVLITVDHKTRWLQEQLSTRDSCGWPSLGQSCACLSDTQSAIYHRYPRVFIIYIITSEYITYCSLLAELILRRVKRRFFRWQRVG